jgi:hypothetical protein
MNWKSLLTASALALAVVGCGDNNPSTAPAPKTTSAPSVETLKRDADRYLADIATAIKENKLDLADKALAKLDGLRAKLPAEYGPKIDQIKQALVAAKAAAKALATAPTTMPKVPATVPATAAKAP